MERTARAQWQGDYKAGKGTLSTPEWNFRRNQL